MNGLPLKSFLKTSFVDWDGMISAVVFVGGCNFRCPFCHNADLVLAPEKLKSIDQTTIIEYLKERREFIDAVCLTGGEPALYLHHGLLEFLRLIKELGLLIKFDTNGAFPEAIEKLIAEELVDYFAMDIKAPFDENYARLAGAEADLADLKQSVELLKSGPVDHEFRTTVVPGLVNEKEVALIAREIAGARRFFLQQFTPANCLDEAYRSLLPYDGERMKNILAEAQKIIPNTFLRGV